MSSPENYDSTGIKPIKNFKTYRNFLKDKKGIDKSEIESLSGGFGREGLTYGRIKGIIENLHKFLELVKFLEDNVSNENKEEEIKKLQWVIIQAEELNSLSFKAKLKEGIKCKKIDKIAREVCKEHHLEKYFGYSVIHSVGYSEFEPPILTSWNEVIIKRNMVLLRMI